MQYMNYRRQEFLIQGLLISILCKAYREIKKAVLNYILSAKYTCDLSHCSFVRIQIRNQCKSFVLASTKKLFWLKHKNDKKNSIPKISINKNTYSTEPLIRMPISSNIDKCKNFIPQILHAYHLVENKLINISICTNMFLKNFENRKKVGF